MPAPWGAVPGRYVGNVVAAADKGYRFSVTDLLIGGLASEIGGLVWSRHADFGRMKDLGLVACYSPT
jgi:predicted nucleic acid-binding protein